MPRCEFLRPALKTLATALLAAVLAGCAALPQAGPTGGRVVNAADAGQFELVEVRSIADVPLGDSPAGFSDLAEIAPGQADRLRPGDAITVAIYEVGVRVFSNGPQEQGQMFDPAARAERLGPIEIEQGGSISLPYVGPVAAAGLTPRQLARDIEAKLRGMSEYPQVVVQRSDALGSAVVVSGEVLQPGRVPLTSAGERLLDAIAFSGGVRAPTDDLMLRIIRRDMVSQGPFEQVRYDNIGGMPLEAGDRIELFRERRSFSVLGMATRTNRFELPLRPYSLAEALAQAGGPNDALADPAAVFVFRYRPGPDGAEPVPVVYHVNMFEPASYLLAQRFPLVNDDVIYIAGAEANQPTKILQLIGQVFSPIVTARQVAR